jgi:uncharacterized protein YqgV (UPF0045/DUF77 family)
VRPSVASVAPRNGPAVRDAWRGELDERRDVERTVDDKVASVERHLAGD